MSPPVTPLFFDPHFEEKIWGGQRLGTRLGKSIPANSLIGESWELSAVKNASTIIAKGPLAGTTLAQLYVEAPVQLVGLHAAKHAEFPLLIKFIDAHSRLSIQVHPDDRTARERYGEPFGKTECWYVADAGSNGTLGIGLRRSVTRNELREAATSGTIENLLNTVRVKTGEMYFIPAGTIHAILDDLLIYEVQQSSNTTFRLYDWNRTDSSGKMRPLHLDEAVACADLSLRETYRIDPVETCAAPYHRRIRVACPHFMVEEYSADRQVEISLPDTTSCRILTITSGMVNLRWTDGSLCAFQGQTLLLPAVLRVTIEASPEGCTLLSTVIPSSYNEVAAPLLTAGCTTAQIAALGYGY